MNEQADGYRLSVGLFQVVDIEYRKQLVVEY